MGNVIQVLLQPVNLVFFALMVILALVDVVTYFWHGGEHHRNFKGEIVGLGILGTFWGIFIGLQSFDTTHIQESIPPLLDGLKTAFLTSIAGMGISMLLTVQQTFIRTRAAERVDDPIKALLQDVLEAVKAGNQSTAATLEQVRNTRMEQRDESIKTREVFTESFATMNASLEAALQKLSEGASKEIIKALEDVIRDFNRNLTEQFGENFKQLNAACLKLVEWQENYRTTIEQMEETLGEAVKAIDETEASLAAIAKRNGEFSELCERLGDTISTSDRQVQELNAHLEHQRVLAMQANTLIENAQRAISETQTRFGQATLEITAGFERTEQGHQAQLANIARAFTDHCNAIISGLRQTNQGVDELTTKMGGALTAQSQSLADLTKRTTETTDKTRTEMAASLREMEAALVSVTNAFGTRYREFLAAIDRLMPQ